MNKADLLSDLTLLSPARLVAPDSWAGHIPLAFFLVEQGQPQCLVELGTHTGNSYFAFCQAVQAARLSTRCYAVDNWQGDAQAGYYGDEVYQQVADYNRQHYADFSTLLRQTFDEALNHFPDGSIDLLHIDGLHTYEAVRHDFDNWRPKLSDRALVLLHDTAVHQRDFGVWRLWQELSARYPHLHFDHSNGLGVLLLGNSVPAPLQALQQECSAPTRRQHIQRLFERLGLALIQQIQLQQRQEQIHSWQQQTERHQREQQELSGQLRVARKHLEQSQQQLKAQQNQIAEQQRRDDQLQRQCDEVERQMLAAQAQYAAVLGSTSWKLTAPLRWLVLRLRQGGAGSWSRLRPVVRSLYHRLPLSLSQRARLRAWYYGRRNAISAPIATPVSRSQSYSDLVWHTAPLRLLLIERAVPRPDQDAGSVMMFNFLRIWRQLGYAVSFYAVDQQEDPDYSPKLEQLGIASLHPPAGPGLEAHLCQHGASYDVIVTCRPDQSEYLLPMLRRYAPQARLVYETHDLHYVREQRQAQLQGDPALLKRAAQRREQEWRILRAVDTTLVVSESERQLLLQEDSTLDVVVIPVVSDCVGPGASFSERADLLFIGGFDHQPNLDAVLFFIEQIFPLIRQRLPQVRFHVVGSNPPAELRRLASEAVVIHGFVADIEPLLNRARVSVNPLRFGAGVKGKIITSLTHGLPCVGTAIAFEGMPVKAENPVLIANEPADFAAAVIRLYSDEALWQRLARSGLEFVSRHFSLAVAEKTFRQLLAPVQQVREPAGLALERIVSLADLQSRSRDERLRRRQRYEAALALQPVPLVSQGDCFVCRQPRAFQTDLAYGFRDSEGRLTPNWREQLLCPGCQLNNRMRAAIHLFHLLCAGDEQRSLYLTEQTTPLFRWFAQQYPQAIGSEYLGEGWQSGAIDCSGLRHEDLTALSFADNQFDAILSFDVLEHIPDYRQALAECCRCLKPGGSLLLSVPFCLDASGHLVRARLAADGQIEHLQPAEYHGNPLSAEGCLCYYHFGWQLLDDLRATGFADAAAYLYWSARYGYLGGDQILFRAIKAGAER